MKSCFAILRASSRLRVLLIASIGVASLAFTPRPASQPATRPATQPTTRHVVNYFSLSYDEWTKLPEANQPVDFEHPDQKLLSAGILQETNRYRAQNKLHPLRHLYQLDAAALIHMKYLIGHKKLVHEEDDVPKMREPIDRVRSTGLDPILVGENIAFTFALQYQSNKPIFPLRQWGREGISYHENGDPIPPHTYRSFAASVVEGWWNSPHHRENILLPDAQFLGAACLEAKPDEPDKTDFHPFYCGQEFFTPRPPSPPPFGR